MGKKERPRNNLLIQSQMQIFSDIDLSAIFFIIASYRNRQMKKNGETDKPFEKLME